MKRFSKVSFDDIKTIQVDSGVLLKEFDVENPVFLPENVICATNGGINPVCEPEYYDFGEDVDNAKSAKETKRIRGWNVSISFTTFTTSLDLIRLALGAADIYGKVLSLRQRLQYAKDFNDIWWVGKRADDKLIAIRLIRSLSDSGFSLQTNKRGKGQISITLKGHSSFAEKDKIPMEIYVFAENDVPVTPDEPVTSKMYLYGTPRESGNIGLRKGESVTYYTGRVYSSLPDWWNEETHPYAFLCFGFPSDGFDAWDVEVVVNADSIASMVAGYGPANEEGTVLSSNRALDKWLEMTSLTYSAGELDRRGPFWSNKPLYTTDGTLYLAGTDPIPVGEIVDTINNIPIYEDLR